MLTLMANVRDSLAGFGAPSVVQQKLSSASLLIGRSSSAVLRLTEDEKTLLATAKNHLGFAINSLAGLGGSPARKLSLEASGEGWGSGASGQANVGD